MSEIVVGGWHTVDEIFEYDCELLDELLGFFGEREGAVVDGGEVQFFEDAVNVVNFCLRFVGIYNWCGFEAIVFLVLEEY